MTRAEAAEYLRISVRQLNRLGLPRTLVGRSPRFEQSTLDLYLRRGTFTPATTTKKGGPRRPPSRPRLLVPVDGKDSIRQMRELARRLR